MQIAIIGAGNGGQALAGYFSLSGHKIRLYDIDEAKIVYLRKRGYIDLYGLIQGRAYISCITNSIEETIKGAELVLVTTVANAHNDVAISIAPYIEEGQVILLNPGRTGGALIFKQSLKKCGCLKHYYLGETQTLIFACRAESIGVVNIIGIKDKVLLAGLPSLDTEYIINKVKPIFQCFVSAKNVLFTSLGNVGAMLHPCICLFNAATIERQDEFWFYRDMTNNVANFIEKVDKERLSVGEAFDIHLLNICDWTRNSYKDARGDTLCDLLKYNPSYYDIKAPGTIFTRQLTEDVPTGIVPIIELGKVAGVDTPLLNAMFLTIEALLGVDWSSCGRTLKNLGLQGKTKYEIINFVTNGE